MSTGYGWKSIRQVRVCATLLSACHVPQCLYGGSASTWGAITCVLPLPFTFFLSQLADNFTASLAQIAA